jgi:hypothetical protein
MLSHVNADIVRSVVGGKHQLFCDCSPEDDCEKLATFSHSSTDSFGERFFAKCLHVELQQLHLCKSLVQDRNKYPILRRSLDVLIVHRFQ